jgi:hypothetical protein
VERNQRGGLRGGRDRGQDAEGLDDLFGSPF